MEVPDRLSVVEVEVPDRRVVGAVARVAEVAVRDTPPAGAAVHRRVLPCSRPGTTPGPRHTRFAYGEGAARDFATTSPNHLPCYL